MLTIIVLSRFEITSYMGSNMKVNPELLLFRKTNLWMSFYDPPPKHRGMLETVSSLSRLPAKNHAASPLIGEAL